jgi:hypothetical protein
MTSCIKNACVVYHSSSDTSYLYGITLIKVSIFIKPQHMCPKEAKEEDEDEEASVIANPIGHAKTSRSLERVVSDSHDTAIPNLFRCARASEMVFSTVSILWLVPEVMSSPSGFGPCH